MNSFVKMFYRNDFRSLIDISGSHVIESCCGRFLLIFPISSWNWETSALARNCRRGNSHTSRTNAYILVGKSDLVEGGRSSLDILSFRRVPKEEGSLYAIFRRIDRANTKPQRVKFTLYTKNELIGRSIKDE
jgi:hypothetical protein